MWLRQSLQPSRLSSLPLSLSLYLLSPLSLPSLFLEYIFFRDDIGLRARTSTFSWGCRVRSGWREGRYNAGLSRESTFLDTSPLSHCPPPNARTKDSEDEKFNSAFKLFSPPSLSLPPASRKPLRAPAGRLSRTEKNNVGYVARRTLRADDLPLIIVTRSIRFRECNETFRESDERRAKERVHRHARAFQVNLVNSTNR